MQANSVAGEGCYCSNNKTEEETAEGDEEGDKPYFNWTEEEEEDKKDAFIDKYKREFNEPEEEREGNEYNREE
jgi:hypothetical protein